MPDGSWTDQFPGFAALDPEVRTALTEKARIVHLPKGSRIFGAGEATDRLLMLISGTVRVQHLSESGREVVLYRVSGGDSCVMTNAFLLAYEDHAAEGIAETDIEAAAIPRAAFDAAIAGSEAFRTMVLSAYARRITDLFQVIDDIAFRRMDVRLAEKLLALAENGTLKATHAQLAAELGTAREVVSRQLAEFQRRGWISMTRGQITLSDVAALAAHAQAPD